MARLISHKTPLGSSRRLPSDYSRHVDRARAALQARFIDSPAGNILVPFFQRGKMLRAYLVFAASASVGGKPEDAHMAAEAIELLHGASLLHDDIIDHSSKRRGMTSFHEQLGVDRALVLGDDLLLLAFSVLGEARSRHPAARVLDATEVLNQLARECCRGQFSELCASRWISEEQYLQIVRGKTAAPFIAAGVLGVLLGGGSQEQIAQIRIYAEHLGVAFQIRDDLLDLLGEPDVLGKPTGNALAHGRPILPLIYLWKADPERTQATVERLDQSGGQHHEIVTLLEEEGILDRVRQVQQRYVAAASESLRGFDTNPAVAALQALAARATSRVAPRHGVRAVERPQSSATDHKR